MSLLILNDLAGQLAICLNYPPSDIYPPKIGYVEIRIICGKLSNMWKSGVKIFHLLIIGDNMLTKIDLFNILDGTC